MNFLLAVDMAAALDDGDNRKIRKPKESIIAKAILIGFVLRSDRGRDMISSRAGSAALAAMTEATEGSFRRTMMKADQGFMTTEIDSCELRIQPTKLDKGQLTDERESVEYVVRYSTVELRWRIKTAGPRIAQHFDALPN